MEIKKLIKKVCVALGFKEVYLRHLTSKMKHSDVVYNVTNNQEERRALLVYITFPFICEMSDEHHQNIWQAREMARIIGEFGYQVDVADYQDPYVRLKQNYDLVVGLIPRNIDYYSKHLNEGALRVAYLTSMNLEVTTRNEQLRLEALKRRRGVDLKPCRGSLITISKEIESFDAAWYIGNEYNYQSYNCFKMPPVSYIKNNGYQFDWYDANVVHNPKKFLFLGSAGQVHKGLDLLLEVFSRPDCNAELYVCAAYEREQDFCKEYHQELFHTPNIHLEGFIDIFGERFKQLTQECAYMIMPSCAEGAAGSVLTAMSAGLIPIVSKECGYSEEDVISLPDCELDTIKNYVNEFAAKDFSWIREQSIRAHKIASEKYSRETFTESIYAAMRSLHKKV